MGGDGVVAGVVFRFGSVREIESEVIGDADLVELDEKATRCGVGKVAEAEAK